MINSHDHGNCELCDFLEVQKMELIATIIHLARYLPNYSEIIETKTIPEMLKRIEESERTMP